MAERPAAPPPLVTVLVILLYIGGGRAVVDAFADAHPADTLPTWCQPLSGAVHAALAGALQLRLRWAPLCGEGLCWIGVAGAAVCAYLQGPLPAVALCVWPALYLVLLTRPAVREWFAPRPAEQGGAGPS